MISFLGYLLPFPVIHFPADRADRREAWRAEEIEQEERNRGKRGKTVGNRAQPFIIAFFDHLQCVPFNAHQRTERTDDFFFRDKPHHRRYGRLPVAEAERREHGGDNRPRATEHGFVGIFNRAILAVNPTVGRREPDENTGEENNGTRADDKARRAFPRATEDVPQRWEVVRGEFHDEWCGIPGEHLRFLENNT